MLHPSPHFHRLEKRDQSYVDHISSLDCSSNTDLYQKRRVCWVSLSEVLSGSSELVQTQDWISVKSLYISKTTCVTMRFKNIMGSAHSEWLNRSFAFDFSSTRTLHDFENLGWEAFICIFIWRQLILIMIASGQLYIRWVHTLHVYYVLGFMMAFFYFFPKF